MQTNDTPEMNELMVREMGENSTRGKRRNPPRSSIPVTMDER
jgi:hypothetical protein